LQAIAGCDSQGIVYRSADFSIAVRGSELSLSGRDDLGRQWKASASFTGLGCKIFLAQLDANGKRDLILYLPGITSSAPYDTTLCVLLFDRQGRPTPWSVTGRFDLTATGIRQVIQSSQGHAIILDAHTMGLPMWGGRSYIADLYAVSDASIRPLKGEYSGIGFPLIVPSDGSSAEVALAVHKTDRSIGEAYQPESKAVAYPLFVRFGPDLSRSAAPQVAAHLTEAQGANIKIDTNAIDAATDHLVLSDGSKLDVPTILVVDAGDGARTILFHPDGSDVTKQVPTSYAVHSQGTDCQAADDCQPFILWAAKPTQ
jgi:hypothetical protein